MALASPEPSRAASAGTSMPRKRKRPANGTPASPATAAIPEPVQAEFPIPKLRADELSDITGLTDRRIRQIAAEGYFRPPVESMYETVHTLSGFIRYQRERLSNLNEELRVEQQALVKARRETAEVNLAMLRGEYVRKDIIGPALRNISLAQRAVLLRKGEQELAPKLAGKTTIEILEAFRQFNDEICKMFSDGVNQWMTEPSQPKP